MKTTRFAFGYTLIGRVRLIFWQHGERLEMLKWHSAVVCMVCRDVQAAIGNTFAACTHTVGCSVNGLTCCPFIMSRCRSAHDEQSALSAIAVSCS